MTLYCSENRKKVSMAKNNCTVCKNDIFGNISNFQINLPVCGFLHFVDLSADQFILLHLESGCCSKQVLPSANPTQVTSRGLFSWLRTGVTCPPTMGQRKSCEKKYFFPSPKKCDTCSHFHAVSFIGNGDDVVSHFFQRMYCI